MEFSNLNIATDELPSILEQEFLPLEKRYRTMLYTRNLLFLLVLAAGVLTPHFIQVGEESNYPILWVAIPTFLLWVYLMLLVHLGFPQKGFLLREHDLLYKTGFFNRKQIAIPKNRIQHIELRQTFLARIFGLSRLVVYTAGGNASDLSIPGLNPTIAEQLKEEISQNIKQHD